jgi:DNA-binding XRE family transcriptional regulator
MPKGYPENPQTLGEHIRKCRMDSGLQIKQLAKQIGVDEMTIINWEVGRVKNPRKGCAERLSIILPELRDLLARYERI